MSLAAKLVAFVAFVVALAAPSVGHCQFAGEWDTTYGRMVLTQDGNRVAGSYVYGLFSTRGAVEGVVQNGRLFFRYTEPAAAGEGWFQASDGAMSFEGQWRRDGVTSWSSWRGVRIGEPPQMVQQQAPQPQTLAAAPAAQAERAASAPAQGLGADLTASIDAVIASDSRGWMFNSYDRGSAHNARIEERSSDGRSAVVFSEYTYNGGSPGWVRAQVQDGVFSCVEYWDFAGRCRPVGSASYAYQVAGALAVATLAAAAVGSASGGYGGGDATNSSGSAQDELYELQRNNGYTPPPAPPPAPVEPIGGYGGLYGCASPPCM
ncbi:MAG: hypothetical protein NW206_18300 [Hyphomonadaceae bacterium]|nr:hypothetical protein [Hyphomonadaceae bacterium]